MNNILILMLTDACNCNCTYCYQKTIEENKMGSLSIDKIEMFDKILPEFGVIQFFGGEPLLAEDFIFELDKRIDQLITKNQLNFKPEYVFSSNLVYLSEKFKNFLLKLKKENATFHFLITVDGISSIHNKHRIFYNGAPTYQCIVDNYKFLMENNMNCIESIYVVYNYSHYQNGISLEDCILAIYRKFPSVKYINFNREELYKETRIESDIFFELKYQLVQSIFEDIVNEKQEYIECKPFLLKELTDICNSIITENSDKDKCVMSGKK